MVRFPWSADFPHVVIHAAESAVKQHPEYSGAKSGDVTAAAKLVSGTISALAVDQLRQLSTGLTPVLISIHAKERTGINTLPQMLAEFLGDKLGWQVEQNVVQENVVNHTGADGFSRLARQAQFSGNVQPGDYVMVDDFIGQGGTLANFRGHLLRYGANVLCATVLTGKPHSARLQQSAEDLMRLREKHGDLETWWIERFGFGFDCLTASETRYLVNTATSQRIRERIEHAA
ncbi:phosphoribosyltransferase [Massilia sp. PAMC28688]|nr:phosphoribosyltransferase [Massilia sp. PAMC28688]